MASSRWHQDKEVAQLIAHFDSPDKFEQPDRLTPSEIRVILKELDRCRKDFVYAARNYFWITNKNLGDQLFSLWPSQELILEKVLELKGKGKQQKLIIIKSRQLGCCLDPETKVLTADLKWIRLDDVQPGQELIGVDEFPPYDKTRRQRHIRRTTVLAKRDIYAPAFKLTMDNGETLIATGEHRFLCKRRGGTEAVWRTVARQNFDRRSTAPIVVGDEIRFLTKPWGESTYEDGWFRGFLDGEGSIRARHLMGCEVSVSQVFNPAYERALKYLQSEGYRFQIEWDNRVPVDGHKGKLGIKPIAKLQVHGTDELLKLLGKTRPSRFIGKDFWEGKSLPKSGNSWGKVVAIEALPVQRMVDLQTSTKTFIANGFVSHNSTLIEAMVAWRTMFFSNVNALVVSYDRSHTADVLFPIMTFIYDHMPWWLKPMCAMRKAEEGLHFDNPKPDLRATQPGLNSRVYVKGANSTTAVGQGIRLSSVHVSEFADFEERTARGIIDEDMVNALAEGENTFAILESTAKGANTYSHRLWKRCVELAEKDRAEWEPLFLPWFFDPTHVRPIRGDFRLDKRDHLMRERTESDWVRCDNAECQQYHSRFKQKLDRDGELCPTCEVGRLHFYVLTDHQLAWMQDKRVNYDRDEESAKKLLQEQAGTAEEAFQVTGYQMFGQKAQDFANINVRPPIAEGDFDPAGRFHGCNKHKGKLANGKYPCFQEDCKEDHEWDDAPMKIWEFPKVGAEYCCGADIAEGLGGKSNYSVGVITRVSTTGGGDFQVATWRANTIDPIGFAYKLNHLGLYYNTALMAVECNRYDICLGTMRFQLGYPNCYRWKHLDSMNILSQKLGWWTNLSSRPRLWQTFKRWLQQELYFVRSHNLAEEMKNFVKDEEDDYSAGGDKDEHDDELIAGMISLYTAHEGDWNDALGMISAKQELTKEEAAYHLLCTNCNNLWWQNTIEETTTDPGQFRPELDVNKQVAASGGLRCQACGGRRIEITRNRDGVGTLAQTADPDALYREAAQEFWTPEKAWDTAQLNYDYDLPS